MRIHHGFRGQRVTIDIEGDGTNEFDGIADSDEFLATYNRPGAHVPSVRMTATNGTIVRRGLVQVYDRASLDLRLQAVWRGFKDALRQGNIQTAVSVIVAERRAGWADFFAALPPDAFQDVDLVYTNVRLVDAGFEGAEYEMLAVRDGVEVSFPIWFAVDDDGRWRLWRF